MNVLEKTGRFSAWLRTYKPPRGPRPAPEQAMWTFAAVLLALAAIRRKSLPYRRPSQRGLAESWEVLTGSCDKPPRTIYRRYQNLQDSIRAFRAAERRARAAGE